MCIFIDNTFWEIVSFKVVVHKKSTDTMTFYLFILQIKHIHFRMLFVAHLDHISWIWYIFQVLSYYRYTDWWEHKVLMPLSAHQGEKPEDTQATQCILAKLHAFHDWNLCMCVCVCELSHSVMSDSATLWTVAPPGSSVHGTFQARIREWVAISSSKGSSRLRDWTHVFCNSTLAGRFFTT